MAVIWQTNRLRQILDHSLRADKKAYRVTMEMSAYFPVGGTMGRMTETEPVFLLGLTMAGAVSAGAYNAGVLDYLFRAIDAHNARVRKGPTEDDPDPPRHRVVVKAMSGASAGGMCTGLAVASLATNRREGQPRLADPRPYTYQATGEDGSEDVEGVLVFEPL